ncbi:glycosyltransferase family 2 protein [Larkinella rosea]|uniref:Glycosyltransferase family 2 protein n=1 Tax=Larkinella rosea TaxID=2025312 RepID=A0A3P1BJR1_9BACT|nr:glycosyltransferase family 2 protein [Larkinella rosea]RRB01242.1 glycosyltransferase family 2 protein [Larkinella rosea]
MSMLPGWLSKHTFTYQADNVSEQRIYDLRSRLARFQVDDPEISIVIPAYNEEANILNTLSSLADQKVSVPTEILVVNNNSSDRTQELLDRCGVRSILEKQPGVAYARQAGLMAARGRIHANADADCLYPAGWAEALTAPLNTPDIACTYGLYSFLPGPKSSRLALACYEVAAQLISWVRNRNKAYLNVYGFNFAFRRADALAIGGFELDSGREGSVAELIAAGTPPPPTGRCEDGLMSLSLQQQGKGATFRVTDPKARVWTSDRRLVADGNLGKAFMVRVGKAIRELGFYLSPSSSTPS